MKTLRDARWKGRWSRLEKRFCFGFARAWPGCSQNEAGPKCKSDSLDPVEMRRLRLVACGASNEQCRISIPEGAGAGDLQQIQV